MKRLTPDSPELKSADLVAENIERLRELFPEAFANEGKIDFDVLRQLLGDRVDDGEERYGLNWHGKRAARQLALTPSTGTLRPCPDESVDWDTTQNIFIEGDNLEVLKLLQKSYAGKVKLIYIDPPYNTGKDFVYPDNFQDSIKNYLEITGQVEGGQRITSNTEASGRFHTDWLNMIYPRLKIARNLLAADGVLFISIDDNEVANLCSIVGEVFGKENVIHLLAWQKKVSPSNDSQFFSNDHEFILVVAKDKKPGVISRLPRTEEHNKYYTNPDNDPRGPWNSTAATCSKSAEERPNLYYAIRNPNTGDEVWPKRTAVWALSKEKMLEAAADNRLYWGSDGRSQSPRFKNFLTEAGRVVPRSLLQYKDVGHTQSATTELRELIPDEQFDYPKPTSLIQHIIALASPSEDEPEFLVCDFFAGSGTTGHAVMAANAQDGGRRRFICVQLPEPTDSGGSITAISKKRLRRAGERLRTELAGDADLGFRVFRLDSGNVRPWEASKEQLAESLAAAVDHVKPDRSEDDLLYDLILKHGLDLCAAIDEKQIGGHKVRSVGGGAVFACFGSRITAADVEQLADGIAKWRDDLAPANPELSRVVFRDSAFETDVSKTNLALILKERGFDEKLVVSL